MVSYAHDSWTQDQNFNFPGLLPSPPFQEFLLNRVKNLVVRLTNILSPATLTHATFGFSMDKTPAFIDARQCPAARQYANRLRSHQENSIPTINIAGQGSIGTQQQIDANPFYTYRDDFSHQLAITDSRPNYSSTTF